MVEYYGRNDWRDYHLSHYGVKGMHWGIRRYQPYSVTGPRKSGEGGKEIGEARKAAKKTGKVARPTITREKAKKMVDKAIASVTRDTNKKIRDLKKWLKEEQKTGNFRKNAKTKASNVVSRIGSTVKKMKNKYDDYKKKKIIEKGSLDEVYSNRHKLTPKELDAAATRLSSEDKLLDLKSKQTTRDLDATKKFVDSVVNLGKSAVSAYSTYKDVKGVYSEVKNKDFNAKKEKVFKSSDLKDFVDHPQWWSNDEVSKKAKRVKDWDSIKRSMSGDTKTVPDYKDIIEDIMKNLNDDDLLKK